MQKKKPKKDTLWIYDGYIIPFLINYEYRFSIFTYLDIAPTISAGISLNKSAYDDKIKP
jgi:hypothetical protein